MPFTASLEEYISSVQVKPRRISLVRSRPLAHQLREVGLNEPVLAKVEGVEGISFAVNLINSRETLYKVLNAKDDREAYERLVTAQERGGSVAEDDFNKFFKVADSITLSDLAFRFYEGDKNPYVTSSIFVACLDGVCNASIHRIMVGSGYYAVRLVPRHLHRMLEEALSRGADGLPVAVIIGVHPLVMLAASLSPPYGVFELPLAQALGGLSEPLLTCRTPRYRLPVPCGASVVVEGVLGRRRAEEGGFVDVLGLRDRVRSEPVLEPV